MAPTLQSKSKLAGLVSLLLVVALGISLAKLMWLVITPLKEFKTHVQETGKIEGFEKKNVNYGKLISDQHLFGVIKKVVAVEKALPEVVKKPVVPPKELNLKLYGIVAYKSSQDGFALISSNNGPQKVFGKGDELSKGVKVSEIFPEKVMIDNNGTMQELVLPRKDVKNTKKSRKQNSRPNPGLQPKVKNRVASKTKSIKKKSPDISGFRKEVMTDPSKLMEIARATPAMVNGEFTGFRLQPGRKRKFFKQLGFEPNDILIEVNGIVVDSPSKGAMILGELSQAAALSVIVKRKGQDVHIQHTF